MKSVMHINTVCTHYTPRFVRGAFMVFVSILIALPFVPVLERESSVPSYSFALLMAHASDNASYDIPLCAPAITKTASISGAHPGDEITYTLSVKNEGAADCTGGGVRIVDHLDQNLVYVSEDHSENISAGYNDLPVYDTDAHSVSWNAHTLSPGETGWVMVTVRVKTPTACGAFAVKNTGKMTAYELNNFGTWVYSNTIETPVVYDCTEPQSLTCDAFTASDTQVKRGDRVTLNWRTSGAESVSINNSVGAVGALGSTTVTVHEDSTYVLTATRGTDTVSCEVGITIETSGGGGGGGGSSAPRCTLKASDTSIASGERVVLTWKNARTNEIVLKDNHGNELIDTKTAADEKKYNEDAGTITVMPTKSTLYTMTAYKGSSKRTCTVEVKVENITVTSTRSKEPLVAGIALTRVPYTGFEAGPLLTTAFYVLLGLWALGIAYVLVMRRTRVRPELSMTERVYTPHTVGVPELEAVTPPVAASAPVYEAPQSSVQYGYAFEEEDSISELETTPGAIDLHALEMQAQDAHVLMSTDALRFIEAQSTNHEEAVELLEMVVGAAKASFPKEDGWVVINKDKIMTLLQ